MPRRGQRLVGRRLRRQRGGEGEELGRLRPGLEPAQRRLGPGREVEPQQRQVEEPLAGVVEQLDPGLLRRQRGEQALAREHDVER